MFQEKNIEFQEPKYFIMGRKPTWFLPKRETLPLLSWRVNKLAFFPEGDIHYLYFASVFTIEISLKRPSRTKVVTAFPHLET